MNTTYIKLFREIIDWEWYGNSNTMRVFIHILLNTNVKPKRYEGVEIKAGQCLFGRKAWADRLGLTEQQIRTAIDHLKSTKEITTKSTNKFTIITVEKWDFWQSEEGLADQQNNQRTTNKQPTNNQRITTPKECKKYITNNSNRGEPPTLDEVKTYVAEKKLEYIDPQFFYDYFTLNEWVDSKGKPVKNWKLKCITWNKSEKEKQNDDRGNFTRQRNRADEYGLRSGSNDRADSGEKGEATELSEWAKKAEAYIRANAESDDLW